jgi:4-hydroxybenzoate polyprenyltransferase
MGNRAQRVAGVLGTLLVLAGFLLGVLLQVGAAWLLLLTGAVLLAYAIYCGSRPFLKEMTE